MRIFIDECVWQVTRDFVQQLGHDVATVEERGLSGADDDIVLRQAVSENRAFLTRDMDLSNILLFPPANYLGIIVLKIKPQTTDAVHRILASALAYFTQDSMINSAYTCAASPTTCRPLSSRSAMAFLTKTAAF